MVKMSKSAAKRRLREARTKMLKVYLECQDHLSPMCQKSIEKMSKDISKIINKSLK